MRPSSLIPLLLVCIGCTVRVPRGIIAVAPAPVKVRANVRATVDVKATGAVATPQPPPPPADAVIVSVQNAPVVEFFGIPLEGATDVVFVLDCSGSMSASAQGRLAEIREAPPPAAAPTAPPGDPVPADPNAPPSSDSPPPDATSAPPADAAQPAAQTPTTRLLTKLEVAQLELVAALQRLPAGTRTNVLFFNNELEAFAPHLVPLDEQGRTTAISFVNETTPTGGTALGPAMRTAFLMNARRIVLLSDGLGNIGGDARTILRDAREAIRGGVRIDTIGLGRGQDAELLQTLATESGGLYQPM